MLVTNNTFKSVNSFSNLFPKMFYDKSILSQPILDIWNNYKFVVFPKEKEKEVYFYYQVKPEDTIYLVSQKFYKTIELWWLVLLANDAINPYTFLDDVRNEIIVIDNKKDKSIRIIKDYYIVKIKKDILSIKNENERKYEKEMEEIK